MFLKYLKLSVYSLLTMNCFYSYHSFAMLETAGYVSEEDFRNLHKKPSFILPQRSSSAPILPKELLEKTSKNVWALRDRKAFIKATETINQDKKGYASWPAFIHYTGDLEFPQDFERLETWLKIPNLKGFSIIRDEKENRDFKAIYNWYKKFSANVNSEDSIRDRLIFMSLKGVIHQKTYVPHSRFSQECLDNHLSYYANFWKN